MRWFEQHLPADASVQIHNQSLERLGFQIAGPMAENLLQAITVESVSGKDFPFFSARMLSLSGAGVMLEALVQRVSYTGDQGFEIYVDADQQVALYELLVTTGKPFDIRPFGMRAMMSLRLEKSFGSWMREFKPDYTPLETGLERFVVYDKAVDFIGKAAVLAERETGPEKRLCTFKVDADDADVWADEPIWVNNEVVGFVTSGGFAHFSNTSVAIGFLPTKIARAGQQVEIEILGKRVPAVCYEGTLLA